MIFVTLGSQKFQFNRLLIALDEQIEDKKITDEIYAQTGASDYQPKNYDFKPFLNRDEYSTEMSRSDIVITHGGTGAIIGAVKQGKKVIAVPRLSRYGEHVDDHQLQLVEQFKDLNLIFECEDCSELWKLVNEIKTTEFNTYHSNTMNIINSIEAYIDSL